MNVALLIVIGLGFVLGVYRFWSVTTQPVVAVITIPAGAGAVVYGAVWMYLQYLETGQWLLGGSLLFRTSPLGLVVVGSASIFVGIVGLARYKLRQSRRSKVEN